MKILLSILLGIFSSHLLAQEWPQKTVRIIVPFPAGGSADLLPRIVGEKLSERWGQPVIIENRPGAAGNIGATAVYNAEPDGYTLLSAPPPPLVINRHLYPKLAFDSTRFVPITVIAAIPNVVLVHPKTGVDTIEAFIDLVKRNPGKLNYSSQGNGTTSHLTTELFKHMAGGLHIVHVPYKGTAPALAALLAGEVELMCDNLGVSLQHVKAGKIRALAVASPKRIPSLPDVPALAEKLPRFEAVAWFGIVGPPGMPSSIAEKIASSVRESLHLPDVRKRLATASAEPMGLTPSETAKYMKEESERWAGVIRTAGVKLQN
jgi:tripartite-type tricarboxylate transporter receptor subunit TctC